MHLDAEQVQRLLHGELAPSAAARARAHLDSCAECLTRVSEAEHEETEVLDLLRALDHPVPRVSAASVLARSRAHDSGRRWSRLAAGVVLALVGAGAAYALPGSPVPDMLRRAVGWVGGREPRVTPAPETLPTEAVEQGIAVAPGARFVIAFAAPQPDGVAIVSLADSANVTVRASGGEATFASAIDRLAIGNEGSTAVFRIQIPRRAPHVEILIGGRRAFVKDAARVITDAPRDADGRYLLSLSARGL
ncbi:MAG TPA: zf-HC2 domain-containing protein [Gemmatimonadaceae bacterium]|nr:zf-HC2 domain-containing protein [Gemmatimonadaceae bacterium]